MKQRNTFTFPNTLIVNTDIKSPRDYEIGDLVKVLLCNIYGISNCTVNIVKNDSLLKRFSTDDLDINALLYKTAIPHVYNLYLSNTLNGSLENILCHEMCHLKQYEDGRLDIVEKDGKKTFKWLGKVIDKKIDYWKRPWEIEARDASIKLWKQFKELYYKKSEKTSLFGRKK